jgi:uncharacterized protein YraI
MKTILTGALLAAAIAILPCAAQAQQQLAHTTKSAHLRAGPARDYPVVAVLAPGFPIEVQGCLSNYSWCDVIAGQSRGWMYAGNITYYYQNQNVPVLNYGAIIGIGVLAFIIDDYWGRYYIDRPWYSNRQRWIHRPPPPSRFVPAPRPGHPGAPPVPRNVRPQPAQPIPGPVQRGVTPRQAPRSVQPGPREGQGVPREGRDARDHRDGARNR